MRSLLDLPREIRDEIYHYVLLSPSGFVAPSFAPRNAPLKSRRRTLHLNTTTTKLHLVTNPQEPPPEDDPVVSRSRDRRSWPETRTSMGLALPRTCRQIYNESHGLFWDRNTFYFEGLRESARGLGTIRALKLMGQTASRLVQRITIRMTSSGADINALRKVLHTLSSRARLGHFKTLELVWEEKEFAELMHSFLGSHAEAVLFDTVVRELSPREPFERLVRVPARPETGQDVFDDVVRLVHLAVGGKMVCGGVVRWEDYAVV